MKPEDRTERGFYPVLEVLCEAMSGAAPDCWRGCDRLKGALERFLDASGAAGGDASREGGSCRR